MIFLPPLATKHLLLLISDNFWMFLFHSSHCFRKDILNCFISFYVFFKQPLKYYLPMKYEGFNKPKWIMYTTKCWLHVLSRVRFQLHVHLECEYIFYIQKHPQCCFCLAETECQTCIPQLFLLSHADTVPKTCLIFNKNSVKLNPPDICISFTFISSNSSSDFVDFSRTSK